MLLIETQKVKKKEENRGNLYFVICLYDIIKNL